jgi:hypothetical protein
MQNGHPHVSIPIPGAKNHPAAIDTLPPDPILAGPVFASCAPLQPTGSDRAMKLVLRASAAVLLPLLLALATAAVAQLR